MVGELGPGPRRGGAGFPPTWPEVYSQVRPPPHPSVSGLQPLCPLLASDATSMYTHFCVGLIDPRVESSPH